jgi:hypothetical protein
MRKKVIRLTLCAMLLALCGFADAEQPKKVPEIGFLAATSPSIESARVAAFQQGLHELGYVEGKTLSLSGDGLRRNSIDCPLLRPSWCVSMWRSSSQGARHQPALRRK